MTERAMSVAILAPKAVAAGAPEAIASAKATDSGLRVAEPNRARENERLTDEITSAPAPRLNRSLAGMSIDSPAKLRKALGLARTLESDLGPLKNLHRLERLTLSGTAITHRAPLGALTNLRVFDLAGTRVIEIAPLHALRQPGNLHVAANPGPAASPLEALPNLTFLNVRNTSLGESQIAGLRLALPALEVYASTSPIGEGR